MIHSVKKHTLTLSAVILVVLLGCSKGVDTTPVVNNNGGGTGNDKDTNCIITAISQVNSGSGSESSLTAHYTATYDLSKVVVYDSIRKVKNFEANFSYIAADSVRIDSYQYLLLDANKRVIRFVKKADMSKPIQSDTYLFEYTYNSAGYLTGKKLFINGSTRANFSTTYNYTNNQLTSCIMTTPSANNAKVLEATLQYDNTVTIKNWIYTLPDAMESYPYLTFLNFGHRATNPIKKVVTRMYDPATGSLVDTWITDYGNYKINSKGFVVSGEAKGDLQQGIAAFYGKTNFYYACH